MTRIETDSLGQVEVPEQAYWGAQTQRSLSNFAIGAERMPIEVLHALARSRRRQPGSTTASATCRPTSRD